MAYGDGHVKEISPGRWQIRFYATVNGRSQEFKHSAGLRTEEEARKLLRKRLNEVAADRAGYAKFQTPRQRRITMNELLDDLVADYRVRDLHSAVAGLDYLSKFFGHMRALAVTPDRIRAFIIEKQEEGFASATINRFTTSLYQALKLGVAAGAISSIPKIPRLREDNARQGFFERRELEAVLNEIPDANIRDFVEFLNWTGMRKGEAASLSWEGFDRESWTLRLHSSHAKTGHGRVIALEGKLREIIERRIKLRRLDCSLIFHRDGQPVIDFRRMWWTACKKAGVAGRLIHDLRRTAVRNMVRAGVPERVAMEISGHRTRGVFDRYNITSEEDLRQAILKTTEYVSGLPVEPRNSAEVRSGQFGSNERS